MDSLFAEQLLKKTRADYDRIALSFSETRERSYDLRELVADVQSGESVLDVGCGNGRLLDVLPVGIHYTGCDTSKEMIAHAQKRSPISLPYAKFIFGDILSLPFASSSFDHVFVLAVLHHIPSALLRQQAVRELARVVRPGGRVTITVWNLRSWYWMRRYKLWRLFLGLHQRGYDRGDCLVPWKRGVGEPILRYVHAFTRRELHALIQRQGLLIDQEFGGRNHIVLSRRGRA